MNRTTSFVATGALVLAGAGAVAFAPAGTASVLAQSHLVSPRVQQDLGSAAHLQTASTATEVHVVDVRTTSTTSTRSGSSTRSTDAAITTAILHSPLLGVVQPADIAVSDIHFASSDTSWAAALATPRNGQTDPAQVVLHKVGATWQVRDLGTYAVGCGIAPATVRAQLGLHGAC
ncbi:hypothetical protein [Rudaeicoccus suwonensis]|uniref:Secreted protein n=1 Tax=Rudaeicoccus suwonensis TaxID=657409 RepID=A0A561EBX1_9MICO|nr:hypothetical protein [Rudaeicoccus suwonensis]TWE13109.1 hypothetical protein BKA23_1938 [Rudaeicoccus suwonensis]